ncbi:PREDICTED: probable WRKY transcription factor 43 [Ipomoea nil]|uniref:probable WRKY transcription factor 43 n=1 Tax=Ipomoea nil TaxID=35883 RepID=UPI000900A55C|nr:PREDICTED: probable WRKY transcription factor 43 [Ipomoea nil]
MEGEDPPPPSLPPALLPNDINIQDLFSFPSTSLVEHNPSIMLSHLPIQSSVVGSDSIDWVGLLSGCMDQMPAPAPARREGENYVQKNKGKRKKYVPPRVAFHTRSTEDILDDGYKWRKYGQKSVKNSTHPRSYYRCTHHTCNVKKQIQRLSKDKSIVVTTYEGIHNHPCEKLMETLTPLLKQLQFLSRF